ncbi:hypothetical protein [Pseudonocardia sp. ICBG601]|uniref:hypothetical protein n=1 Tax=Pseudonocardia sp. ICBG601 TaxID=2846759 RepID=UPI001CF6CD18|nr:hypothetical protein [Pseudonocardia sp. ICBG601]
MMAFAYYDDPREELRGVAAQWREGRELATVFPCDGGKSVVLLMPPVERAEEFRRDATARSPRPVGRDRAVGRAAARLHDGVEGPHLAQPPVVLPALAGAGLALAGDAGHFKDPVTAQGIRDALRFGRLLGEAVAPYLDDPADLDAALARWESDRDEQCLPMYQWANGLGRDDDVSPLERASYRWFAASEDRATELWGRVLPPAATDPGLRPARLLGWVRDCLRDPAVDRAELWRVLRARRRPGDRQGP